MSQFENFLVASHVAPQRSSLESSYVLLVLFYIGEVSSRGVRTQNVINSYATKIF